MKIYGEYLFIENFLSGYIILLLTKKILLKQSQKYKIAISAIMCGAFSFFIFADVGVIAATLVKLGFSAMAVYIAFGKKKFLRTLGVFYIVSAATGGISFLLLFLCRSPGITNNGFIYFEKVTYFGVAAGIVTSYIVISRFAAFVHKKREEIALFKDIKVTVAGQKFEFTGYIDSGNTLTEPISGQPVILLSKGISEEIRGAIDKREQEELSSLIPYKSVGCKYGVLEGIRAESVKIGEQEEVPMVLAFYGGSFSMRSEQGECQCLIGKSALKAEIKI